MNGDGPDETTEERTSPPVEGLFEMKARRDFGHALMILGTIGAAITAGWWMQFPLVWKILSAAGVAVWFLIAVILVR